MSRKSPGPVAHWLQGNGGVSDDSHQPLGSALLLVTEIWSHYYVILVSVVHMHPTGLVGCYMYVAVVAHNDSIGLRLKSAPDLSSITTLGRGCNWPNSSSSALGVAASAVALSTLRNTNAPQSCSKREYLYVRALQASPLLGLKQVSRIRDEVPPDPCRCWGGLVS